MDAVEMLKRDAALITLMFRKSPLRAPLTYHYQSAMASRGRDDMERYLDNVEAIVAKFLNLK